MDGERTSGNAWRAVVAALVNEDLRAEYARVVLGTEPLHERRVAQLVQAGLVEVREARAVPAVDGLRAMLAVQSTQRPQRGPERFLRPDGAIDRYPARHGDRVELLQYIADAVLPAGERCDERTLNDRLRPFDEDVALLRRYLVDAGILGRSASGSEYFVPERGSAP